MIVITCPTCYSTHVKRDEREIEKTGKDAFECEYCKEKFELPYASYRSENNIFSD